MPRNLLKLLRARTVKNKFNIIIGLIIFILLFGLLNFWFGIKVTSGIRAYVGGEGLWSKAQKEELNNLVHYAHTGNIAYYTKYLQLLRVQAGDNRARLELNKANPDYTIIYSSFVQGGNNPGDVDDMVFLYRYFKHVSYMHDAIAVWSQGDQEMINFRGAGEKIHSLVQTPSNDQTTATTKAAQLDAQLAEAYTIDARLTVLENQFSATLSNGSRNISQQLVQMTIFITLAFGALTLLTAILIARAIIRLDKLKTEFVSVASHQLRTPLTAINWYTEALLAGSKGPLNTTQHEYLAELSDGGKRMSSLISDLLRASSLDLGTYKSELKQVSTKNVVRNVIKDLQKTIDSKRLKLTVAVDDKLPDTKLDEQLLAAMVQNLLSNSVKYTPNDGAIVISIERQHQFMLIHVADSGIGIPRDQQSQIFKKLFRADNAKQLDANGSGLGLYIVKAISDRMGGSVWFTSNEGHGSGFYVKLPLYRGLYAKHRD